MHGAHNNIAEAKDWGLWEEQIAALLKKMTPSTPEALRLQNAHRIIQGSRKYKDPETAAIGEHKQIIQSNVLKVFANQLNSCR